MKQTKLIPLLGLGLTLFLSKPHLIYGSTSFGGGSGTEVDPYRLSTPEHLTELQVVVDSGNSFEGKYFVLTNDIDFTGYDNDSNPDNGNFEPIGEFNEDTERFFSGNLDGKGYAIQHLSIKQPDNYTNGLFACTLDASIKNIRLDQINVEGFGVAGLSGFSVNTSISQVTIKGDLKGEAVGGIVGGAYWSTIEDSYFEGAIEGNDMEAGGIAGFLYYSSVINAKFKGDISGPAIYVGGISGMVDSTTIQDCQVEGDIQGMVIVGGIIGDSEDLILSNVEFEGSVKGLQSVGGIIGESEDSILSNVKFEGSVVGEMIVGGLVGFSYANQINQSFVSGDIKGEDNVGGLIGFADPDNLIEQSFVSGNIEGLYTIGGLIGVVSQPLTISDTYSVSDVTGQIGVGGLIGSIDDYYAWNEVAIIENSYHDGIINGTTSTGNLVGLLGYYDGYDDIWYDGSVSLDNVYYNVEKNPNYPTIGDTTHGTVIKENTFGLTTAQLSKYNAKETMTGLDFDKIWVMTSTTPMFRWQKDLISATEGDIQVNGTIQTMVADVTIPAVSPDLVINPNLEEGYVAPEFSISNDSVSPIKLELKTFEQTTNTFNDVLPTKYDSWIGLNKRQSQDLALGLVAKEGEGWQTLTTPTSYVANHTNHEIGVIKPTSSVDFSFDVKHGTSFSEAKTVQYKMVFVFDLMN